MIGESEASELLREPETVKSATEPEGWAALVWSFALSGVMTVSRMCSKFTTESGHLSGISLQHISSLSYSLSRCSANILHKNGCGRSLLVCPT